MMTRSALCVGHSVITDSVSGTLSANPQGHSAVDGAACERHSSTTECSDADSVAGGPATAGGTATESAGSGALSVTRPAEISVGSQQPRIEDCRVLLAGTDTLDFGMFVEFDAGWSRIAAKLAQLKRAARGTAGLVVGGGRCLVLPGGKPNYPFHIQYSGFQLYLSRKSRPDGETPNVFVSLNSELLWHRGERAAIEHVQAELAELAPGIVQQCRISRCDLAVDLLLPGGLTDDFVRRQAVSHVGKHRIFTDLDRLETMYVGATDSDILLRIYDKSAEVAHSEKLWFLPLWGLEQNADVWRFEFQVRRPMLRSCRINTLDDLLARRSDLWQYLTYNWFTLRLPDNENATRRTVHPLWQIVQQCAERFGPATEPIRRQRPQSSLDPLRSVRQAAGSLVGYAVRKELTTLEVALQELGDDLRHEFQERNFGEEWQRKAIQLGVRVDREAA